MKPESDSDSTTKAKVDNSPFSFLKDTKKRNKLKNVRYGGVFRFDSDFLVFKGKNNNGKEVS